MDNILAFVNAVIIFLAWAIGAMGCLISLFGIITLGMGFSNDNASDKQKGILAIIGGIMIVAVGILIGVLGPDLLTPPTF